LQLGALSFDVTESRGKLQQYDETLTGGSYRLSYSKRFDDFGSQVTFAGYRFSDRNYMSMGEYLDARASESRLRNSKEMYTVTFNQEIEPLGVTLFLNYNHQTYWDGPANDRYSATVSRYFDLGRFKNLSVSLSGFRNQYNGVNDDGAYLSLSMPFGNSGNVNYSGAFDRNNNTHQVNYYDQIGDHDSYSIGSGYSSNGATASGYYSHEGDFAQMDANASYQDGGYSSVGLGLRGGVTATMKGAALHRTSTQGGTRMLLDTNGVPGIPIGGYGATTETNLLGNAVVTDVSSYYRNKVSIDVNNLPDNADATSSVVQATLTEGAIGYRHFEVISGEKAMAVIRLADGSTPPFGATVINSKKQEVGIVNDEGNVYLSGIKAGEQMSVHWNGQAQCTIDLPKVLTSETIAKLLLPCHR
jgi:outer membrane usher protein FimD/PapC